MKNFNDVCKNIDWLAMKKARVTVKKFKKTNPELIYLSKFLDEIVDSAIDIHGIKVSDVFPNLTNARLVSKKRHNN